MGDLSALVTSDSREPIERLRRARLWQIAEANGISYPVGAPKTQMIQLLKGAGVDVTRPVNGLQWQQRAQMDEGGRQVGVALDPVEPANGSQRAGVSDDRRMSVMEAREQARLAQEQASFQEARVAALEQENKDLRALIESRLAQVEASAKADPHFVADPILPLESMTKGQLQLICKARGIPFTGPKEKLIERIRVDDAEH